MSDSKKKDVEIKTISAPPEFWEAVDEASAELGGIGRSGFIRLVVSDYLKGEGKQLETAGEFQPLAA